MDEIDFRDAYAAPRGEPAKAAWSDPERDRPDLSFLATWERRRVLYNGVLAGVVVAMTGLDLWRPFLDPAFWRVLLAGAFGANVCFCTGPIVEAYARWLGVRGRTIGPILFGLGLLLSIPLTFVCVVGVMLAKMDF